MYFIEKIIENLNIQTLRQDFDMQNSIFFDIETTGLSPLTSHIMLIGLMFNRDNKFILRQYFANDRSDEIDILNNFIDDIRNFNIIYHYNGSSFDIPYISQRLKKNNINYEMINHTSVDIYKNIKNNNIYNLESLKLKNVENYMGIHRQDDLSGREIIDNYKTFIVNKDVNLRNKILLHNEEDVVNLYKILPILNTVNLNKNASYKNIDISIKNVTYLEDMILINGVINSKDIASLEKNKWYIFSWNDTDQSFNLQINIFEGIIYYIFKDYKNYYYVPQIDEAIHKSIIKYFDYNDKIPANLLNCYTKQNTKYIILPSTTTINTAKKFLLLPGDSQHCVKVDDVVNKFGDRDFINIINCIITEH